MRADQQFQNDRTSSGQQPVYRTRWAVWCVLAAGWLCGVFSLALRGGAVEWFLTAAITLIGLISGLAPFLAAAGIEAVRTVSADRVDGGREVVVSLLVKRAYAVPFVWLAIQDIAVNVTSIRTGKVSFRTLQLSPIKPNSQITYKLMQLRRGKHQFGEVTVTAGDWLGLTAVRRRLPVQSELTVLPSIPAQELTAAEPSTEARRGKEHTLGLDDRNAAIAAELKAAMRSAGIGPDSRPYREGDSLRHVDWRAAARGNDLQTKLHGSEEPALKLIALDTVAESYDKEDRLFDAAASWASLALEEAVMSGADVMLLTGQKAKKAEAGTLSAQHADKTDKGLTHTAIEGARSKLAGLQLELAELRAGEASALQEQLKEALEPGRKGGAIFLFTGNWRTGSSWAELATLAAEHGCRLELYVVTGTSVPTFAMREAQKWLESGGIKLTWLHEPEGRDKLPFALEGGGAHAYA